MTLRTESPGLIGILFHERAPNQETDTPMQTPGFQLRSPRAAAFFVVAGLGIWVALGFAVARIVGG